jgi:hypothetical protein
MSPSLNVYSGYRYPDIRHTGIDRSRVEIFVAFGIDHFAATIIAVRADMVAAMDFTRIRLNTQGRRCKRVVRTTHVTAGF